MTVIFDHVYEDPRLELMLCKQFAAKKVLCIASGGCTALTIKTLLPELEVSVVDTNADQLSLVQEKVALLESGHDQQIKQRFDIGERNENSFSAHAVFDRINRCLRFLTHELLLSKEELSTLFLENPYPTKKAAQLLNDPHWDLVFDMVYGTSLVSLMLSGHVSHQLKRDKIGKFLCNNIRLGLCSDYAGQNYILQKLFLGHYLPNILPIFLQKPCQNSFNFEYFHCGLDKVPGLDNYDVISLSNICSWMNAEQMKNFMSVLGSKLKPGAVILLRETSALRDPEQNPIHVEDFSPRFAIDESLSKDLLALESSMLFDEIYVGKRIDTSLNEI
jgi:S-adenosylmethionine:diacylglycerol 3-amino-3-carboxypropyl transferase